MKAIRVLVSIIIFSLTLSSCNEKEDFKDYDDIIIHNIKKVSADNGEDTAVDQNDILE